MTQTTQHKADSELLRLVDRLRGKIVIRVNDGAGLLNGKDYFEQNFPTSRLALEAADEIDRLRNALETIKQCEEQENYWDAGYTKCHSWIVANEALNGKI